MDVNDGAASAIANVAIVKCDGCSKDVPSTEAFICKSCSKTHKYTIACGFCGLTVHNGHVVTQHDPMATPAEIGAMHEVEVRNNIDESRRCAEMATMLKPVMAEVEKASNCICNKLHWGIRCDRHFDDRLNRDIRLRVLDVVDFKTKEEVEDRRKSAGERQLSMKRAFDAAEQAIKELASILTSDEPQPSTSGSLLPGPSASSQDATLVTLDSDDE